MSDWIFPLIYSPRLKLYSLAPNSPGVYSRVKNGVAASVMPWDIAVPDIKVTTLSI